MSKARKRQLARQYERRLAERRARERRRRAAVAAASVVGALGVLVAFLAFVAGGGEPTPSPSPSARVTGPTGAEPGKRTGTVTPSPGPVEVACGAEAPRGADRPKPQFAAPAQVLEEGKRYTATLRTSCGDIVIELLPEDAPETVNSFVFLARRGFFDGTRFHRIDASLDVIQGGDPTGTGSGGPGYTIPDELTGDERYGPGVVAMANVGPDTGGSQFFIVAGPGGHQLDARPAYTIFGRVLRGMDVVRRIARLPIQDPEAAAAGDLRGQQPAQAVYLEAVTVRAR